MTKPLVWRTRTRALKFNSKSVTMFSTACLFPRKLVWTTMCGSFVEQFTSYQWCQMIAHELWSMCLLGSSRSKLLKLKIKGRNLCKHERYVTTEQRLIHLIHETLVSYSTKFAIFYKLLISLGIMDYGWGAHYLLHSGNACLLSNLHEGHFVYMNCLAWFQESGYWWSWSILMLLFQSFGLHHHAGEEKNWRRKTEGTGWSFQSGYQTAEGTSRCEDVIIFVC